jgi:glycosyltransferase involved in cell wall biosynthesis
MIQDTMIKGNKTSRRKVLMLAYACSPYRGSEPGTGWNRAFESAKYNDTWVICEEREFRADIERWLQENGEVKGLHFTFVPRLPLADFFMRHALPLYYFAYNLWHRRAFKVARKMHKQIGFDLAHQANMCGYREPGYLWRLRIPFLWGPIGGTQNYPSRFLTLAGFPGAPMELLRSIINNLQLRTNYRVRRALQSSRLLLTANSEGKRIFEKIYHVNARVFLEIGLRNIPNEMRRDRSNADGPLRIFWSGVMEPRKALPLLIEALRQMPSSQDWELRVLGNGKMEKSWKRQVQRAGIGERCTFMGTLPLQEAMKQMEWADVFAFTSLRDTAGTVVLEALSRGVPVICMDHQGAGDIINDTCGIKIPVTNPKEASRGIRDALVLLASDREKLEILSQGALLRAKDYHWERMGRDMAEIHKLIIDESETGNGPHGWELGHP